MTDDVQAAVGEKVRAAMQEAGISQAKLGEALGGLNQSSIARRLAGSIPFTVAELIVAAEFIGVPVTQFLPFESATAS